MSPATPTVTAMMLVRDRADLLPDAAASVLTQHGVDLELIILDDGSIDETWEVAQALAERDQRVRLLRNEHALGIPASRNLVLEHARGRFVAICDSDDLSRPERLRHQLLAIADDPDLVGVGSRINAFTSTPIDGHEPDWHWGLRDGRLPFAFPSALLRLDAVRAAGGFHAAYAIAEDLHLAYRLAGCGGTFHTVDEVLVDYRVHPGSITAGRARTREWRTLRAQLRGLWELRGRFSARGYAVIAQSTLRWLAALVGLRR